MKNIFVGNLDFSTGEDDLRQLFAQHGAVARVSLMTDRDTSRSRGFAFVEMTNTADGEKAIAALNGTQLGGRTISVNEARPKVERGGGRDRSSSRGGARHGGRW
ncbi:MAG: RNA-binding protein [Acidobacteria bacterium]|nr:MAG: RNA-binding protein [Acidobacteriota bacterium]